MNRHTRLFLASLFGLGLLLAGGRAFAAACLSNTAVGLWSAAGSWTGCGGLVPGAADTATIQNGHIISLDAAASPRTVTGITVNSSGMLNIGSAAAAVSLTVGASGITTLGSGIFRSNSNFAATHTLSISGNISNAGTFNLAPNATSLTNATFNLNGNQTVSGAGTYTFNRITLNMGATNANVLDMQMTSGMTAPAGFLTITNGTYKHSNTSNITPWTAAVTIPASGGFWLNGAATVTATGFNVSVTGLFRISAGTMTIGNATTTQLILNNASTFQMDGGVLTVTGGLDSAATTSTGTFTMSGGSINVMTAGAGAVTSFMLGSGTTLNWSGGTITLVNGDNTTNDLELRSGTVNVSGGTLQIGSGATSAANQFLIVNGTGASFTVWNLTLAAGVARTTTLGSIVNVLNSLTIQANNTLVGGGFAINVGDATGNATPGIGNWTNNGAYTTGTSTVSFVGPGAATLGGTVATTFQNLTINKSAATNTVTINSASAALSPTVNGTLSLTRGKIFTTIGTNDIGIGTAGTISGASATSYVVGSVQKNYAAAGTLTFPVGDATNYTPVVIAGTAGFTAGSLTINTTGGGDHPSIASSGIDATKSVNRYWTLTAVGIPASTYNATFNYINGSPVDFDAGAAPANFVVEQWNGTTWFPTTLNAACTATPGTNLCEQINGETGFGDFAIGDPILGFTAQPGQFNGFDTATPANSILGMIQTKQAGIAFSVRLVHVLNNAIDAAYTQAGVTVELLDSSDNSGALNTTTGCRPIGAPAGRWHPIAGTSQLVNFAAGVATATFTAAMLTNAYRDVRVHIIYSGNPVANRGEGCSTDRFALRPQSLTITAYDQDWQTAGTTRALANTGASGGNVHKASTSATPLPFTLRATPIPASATNYDGTPTTVAGFPSCTGLGALCTNPGALSFTVGSWTAAGSGVRENATATYSEAGAFNLQFEDAVYASVDAVDGTPAATLTIPATATAQIGRFVPDHFDVTTLVAPTFRTFNVADAACSPGAAPSRAFTYIGQPFGYLTTPQATIIARNAAGVTTTNYTGTLWKIGGAAPSTVADCLASPNPDTCQFTTSWSAGGNSSNVIEKYTYALTPVSTPNWDGADATAAAATLNAGTGIVTYAASDTLAFKRSTTTPQATFTASITNTISVQDTSEVGVTGNGAIATTTVAVFGGIAFDSGNEFRYGQMQFLNAHGSGLLALDMPIQIEYWNGTQWLRNAADNCTSVSPSNFALGNVTGFTSTSASGGGTVLGGGGKITLAKPIGGTTGTVDVTINLGATGTANANPCPAWAPAATALDAPYLQSQCAGAGTYTRDPSARATFGIYSNKFIFLRENY